VEIQREVSGARATSSDEASVVRRERKEKSKGEKEDVVGTSLKKMN
jgi:hypothetical protein